MQTRTILFILCFFTCLSIVWAPHLAGEPLSIPQESPAVEKNSSTDSTTMLTLMGIIQSIEALQDQFGVKERELQVAATEDQKTKILTEMKTLNERLEALQKNFEGIATGVDLESFTAQPSKRFDWKAEIEDILSPFIEELKGITARPREIERLRSEVAYYEKRLPIIERAIQNVQLLIAQTKDQKLGNQLSGLKKIWEDKKQEIANQLVIAQYQLDEKLKGEKPFVKSTQEMLQHFFKSRGLNLLLALLAFMVVFLLFRLLYRVIFKISPGFVPRKRSFYSRLADVMYHVLTFVGATGALVLVLYISGDWVLLGFAFLFLFGLAWTAKQAFPLFWEQVQLLLNLSTVRENERVIYNGLPWKVASLNLNTRLHNPALKGGMIRLPLRELVGLHSRPFYKDEPWFPCQENDWVMLADGTFGQISLQTPEMVQLLLLGGSRKTYPTPEFLRQHPNNLSDNFRLNVTIGIDYRYQAISTQEIPAKLQHVLKEELAREGYGDALINLTVEFKGIGASALELAIIADFSGQVAKDHYDLPRMLQRIAVDACNTYGWVIPFTQITLHMADSPGKQNPPQDDLLTGKEETETFLDCHGNF